MANKIYVGQEGAQKLYRRVKALSANYATAEQGAKADAAYQKPVDGIPKADLDSGVQASLGKADTALQGHQDISGKADKVSSATKGNLASLDATGNLVDSGVASGVLATKAEVATTYATKESVEAKQDSLTFGYNSNNQIVSIDSHDLAPSADSTVYLAHYTATTGANIKAALNANKAVMSKSGNTDPPSFGLLGSYNLTNNQYQFTIIKKTTNVYGQDAGDINYSGVFCDGSGSSWFAQTGSLTFKAPTSAGQVMKSVRLSNGKYDWALSTINDIPSSTAADENKVLSVNSQGSPEWTAINRDVFGTVMLDENDIPVLDESSTPDNPVVVYDADSTDELWTSFANHEFGARRTYEDQDGNNIKATYATKSSVDTLTADLETALDTLNDTIETVSHAGMYDLGTKTESDLSNGKLAIGCGNSNTELTLTTISSVTVLANSGVPNFALLVDNSGNSNDVTVTVKDSTDATTFYQSTAAGNKVSAGKICQITCVGKCWTLAEFEAPE